MGLSVVILDVFAKRLKELRLSRRMTLQNVGDVIGSNRNTLSNLENAQKSPSLNMVLALADFFGVSVDYLVGRTDNSEPSPPRSSAQQESEEDALKNPPAEDKGSMEPYRKLCSAIGTLREDGVEKAMSYVTFLRYSERKKERQARRGLRTERIENME
ncbi:hypothetical protein AGMMS49957_09500 [Synergistales bacterium]|nr:hypothetical protein AGMMS49957_09500 [Synergistales bacterium]